MAIVINCTTGEETTGPDGPPVIPVAVDMASARLALLAAGITAAMVDAEIAAFPSPEKEAAQIAWEYRTTVRRDSAIVASLGTALGLTEAQIDALFVSAAIL